MQDLIRKHAKFKDEKPESLLRSYQDLESSQKPTAMLITCVDSRILPEQLLGIEPGEVFCLRNVANLVAPEGQEPSTESAIKYAVAYLGVKHIIVMGHSNCGGINALINGIDDESINPWLEPWQDAKSTWDKNDLISCQQKAVLASIENISNMSFIDESIHLHAWHFDIATAEIAGYNPKTKKFIALTEEL